MERRLLAGPSFAAGAESLREHTARLGSLPTVDADELIGTLDASGLLGRGGAGFPAARKWRAVAERAAGGAAILVNGAEGEPLSAKDRALMTLRPHLVVDGAELAARAVGADRIVLYLGSAHADARRSMIAAVRERPAPGGGVRLEVVDAPEAYVAGEESAAVHFVNDADARPTAVPPRPFESGLDGRPTLVQNVETLANTALVARNGAAWYREPGRGAVRGTALVTVSGAPQRGVREIELGTTIGEVADVAGADRSGISAVLLGGYFGGWLDAERAWTTSLDPMALREAGAGFGCGVVSLLSAGECGVRVTARIMDYMAGQSAAQCGPCVFGLRAISDAVNRIAVGVAAPSDLERCVHWTSQLAGRGACRFPDGAVALMTSALAVFGPEFELHQRLRRCAAPAERRKVA